MAIHGFAFLKFAKPAHEHHLQVFPTLRKPASESCAGTLKATQPNGINYVMKHRPISQ